MLFELPARDVGQNDTIAPPHQQSASVLMPRGKGELWIALQLLHDGMSVAPSLLHRAGDLLEAIVGHDGGGLSGDPLDSIKAPVLDFQDQHPATRMQNDKIRMQTPLANGHVVPAQVVIFQMTFHPLSKTPLTRRHT